METQKERLIQVRRRTPAEVWDRAIAEYLAGARASEVAAKYGVSAHSIYQRVSGRGKKRQKSPVGNPPSPSGLRRTSRQSGAEQDEQRAQQHLRHSGRAERGPESRANDVDVGPGFRVRRCAAPRNDGAGGGGDTSGPLARGPAGAPAVHITPLVEGGGEAGAFLAGIKGVRVRRHHAQEIWRQARRDYEEGGFTAPVVAAWYGASTHAVKRRARVEGWSKIVRALPAALFEAGAEAGESGEDAACAWERIAHEAQRAPEGTWSTWLFQGGRGAGKTRAGAEWLAARAERVAGLYALVGPTQHDVREVMVDGPSGIRNLPGRSRPHYERSRRRLLWANGSVAYAFSAEEPERLRGPQFGAAWADEFCIWPRPSETLAILRMGLRVGSAPQLVVTTTPKPIPALRALRAEASCAMTQAATKTNADHLAPSFLDGLAALYGGTRLAAQELEGLLVEGDGALWRAGDLARARGARPAQLERVVVGVDPPAGHGGAACGIVVAGRAGRQAYVLADRSALGLSPLGWATRACDAAREFGAAEIVAEANQGGDMVRATLAQAGPPCAVKLVHASRGKRARAEPIAALYEQGRVTHVEAFAALEEELMALGVAESEGLLDRADALVWALSALMLGPPPGEGPRISLLGPELAYRSGLSGR